jgi:hypothetical protein
MLFIRQASGSQSPSARTGNKEMVTDLEHISRQVSQL